VIYVAVVGPGNAQAAHESAAEEVGRLIAERRAILVCGGLGGVMEAACRGARAAEGVTVGLLAGTERDDANAYVSVALPTGLGQARNAVVVRSADSVVAIGGGYGTLSEIALALRRGKPVIGLDTWDIEGVQVADGPEAAVRAAFDALA
jgi:uncharacterized protein (TIGR00725 family)